MLLQQLKYSIGLIRHVAAADLALSRLLHTVTCWNQQQQQTTTTKQDVSPQTATGRLSINANGLPSDHGAAGSAVILGAHSQAITRCSHHLPTCLQQQYISHALQHAGNLPRIRTNAKSSSHSWPWQVHEQQEQQQHRAPSVQATQHVQRLASPLSTKHRPCEQGQQWQQSHGQILQQAQQALWHLADHRQSIQRQGWQQRQQQRSLHLAPPFLLEDFTPAAVTSYRLGRMPAKLKAAEKELEDCRVCPRNCGVNRLKDELGVCNVGRKVLVSTVAPHFAEEAPLQGWNGSGTVFFSMCNLRCVFCQNWDISQKRSGFELTGPELADWMIKLQDFGKCHNINFVTPEHVAPQIVEAIASAVEKGLNLPIIHNTSAYDGLQSLALMDGLVDIYMPDFKFWTSESSRRYAKAKDYPQVAKAAIKEMHRQVGDLVFTGDGLAKRGLLLRHLVMPGLLDEGKAILDWVVKELGRDTFVHIMEQYIPRYLVGSGQQRSRDGWTAYDEINKRAANSDVEELKQYARGIGLWRFEEMAQWETGELAG